MATLALIGLTLMSCKEKPKQEASMPLSVDEGNSIMIQSTVQKKEEEKFKVTLDSTLNTYDIRIAELKIKMQLTKTKSDSSARMKIKVLQEKNQTIKSKINIFNGQTTKDWNSFKSEINTDLKDFEMTINQFTSDKK